MKVKHNISVGLVHWPVVDRLGKTVATNVTNFDIHDIARCCRTYGVKKYYIINKVQEQLMFVSRVLEHWNTGQGSEFNPMRRTALGMVETAVSVDDVLSKMDEQEEPLVVTTAARSMTESPGVSFRDLREHLAQGRPVLLLFGTGFGLHEDVLAQSGRILEPIHGASEDEYKHLSVRSAVSICLDRLLGSW